MGKGMADLVSSLEADTLTKSTAKLRLRLSTSATFAEGLAKDGETSGHRLDFLKVRFGIRTFPACFARLLTDLYFGRRLAVV
jgi:hypothetical protein